MKRPDLGWFCLAIVSGVIVERRIRIPCSSSECCLVFSLSRVAKRSAYVGWGGALGAEPPRNDMGFAFSPVGLGFVVEYLEFLDDILLASLEGSS